MEIKITSIVKFEGILGPDGQRGRFVQPLQQVHLNLTWNAGVLYTLCKGLLLESLGFEGISWKAFPMP